MLSILDLLDKGLEKSQCHRCYIYLARVWGSLNVINVIYAWPGFGEVSMLSMLSLLDQGFDEVSMFSMLDLLDKGLEHSQCYQCYIYLTRVWRSLNVINVISA